MWMCVTWPLLLVIVGRASFPRGAHRGAWSSARRSVFLGGSQLLTRCHQLGRVAPEQPRIERLAKDRSIGDRVQIDLSRYEQDGKLRVPGQRVDGRPQGETIEPRHEDVGDDERNGARIRGRER